MSGRSLPGTKDEGIHRSRHRLVAAIGALLAVAFAGVVVVGTVVAQRDQPAAHANSLWLAKQLRPDGTLENPMGAALPDHGLMIDVLLAMYASGDGDLAAPIAKYLDDDGHATDYYTWDGLAPGEGYDAIIVGGAAAKVLVAAEVSGRDPRDFDGVDMVAETKAAVMRSGPDKGRISNYSKNPEFADFVSNDANMFGQALGVIGLAGVGELDQLALDKMLTQQCSEGYFRIFFAYIPTNEVGEHVNPLGYKVSTCDEGKPFDMSPPDGDTTGLGLSAMLAARAAGAQGLDGPIAKAVAWLRANQKPSGGWGGGVGTETPNTNSTGLIVQALAAAGGAPAEVAKGAAFLKSAQVKPADAQSAIGEEIGAIAYTPEAYEASKTQGRGSVDTWIRAGAQASLGISEVSFYDLTKGKIPTPPTSSTTTTTTTTTTTRTTAPMTTATTRTTAAPPTQTTPPQQRVSNQNRPITKPVPKPKPRRSTAPTPTTSSTPTPVAPPPQPAPALSPAGRLGEYLAQRLVGGERVEVTENGETFVDYDATADLVLALRVLDERPEVADSVSRFLLRQESIEAYAYGLPYEQDPAAYAEPLAKLRIIAGFLRRDDDDASSAITATIDDLRIDLVSLRTEDGTFADRGEFADRDDTVRRHAWAILASAADGHRVPAAVTTLLKHQCADGTFPATLKTDQCETGDPLATAAAIEALNARALPDDRRTALVRALDALAAKNDPPDVLISSAVAGARSLVGLDVRDLTEALHAMQRADGGFPKPGTDSSDLVVSIGSAQGVASRSWISTKDSPVTPASRLPIGEVKTATAAAQSSSDGLPGWAIGGLVGLGILLAAMTGIGTRRYLNKKTPTEGEAS